MLAYVFAGSLRRVVELFRAEGVPVVNVGLHVAGRPAQELVVNRIDSHANERVQALMAELLAREIEAFEATR